METGGNWGHPQNGRVPCSGQKDGCPELDLPKLLSGGIRPGKKVESLPMLLRQMID